MPRGGYDSTYLPKAPKAFGPQRPSPPSSTPSTPPSPSSPSSKMTIASDKNPVSLRGLTVNVGRYEYDVVIPALPFDGSGNSNNVADRPRDVLKTAKRIQNAPD
ncbi:hypothetical protein D0861_02863 [Hortaea werneckii]|uniref:Uncharacterized protein n=1 Tax=Hortaea werneckii TaxID=91943 RepID=A0A3M7FSK9_HORWE|nr:hypothetical protein D0861_02863 [Hortaea werneckii]